MGGTMGASLAPVTGLAAFYHMMLQQFFIVIALAAMIGTIYVLWTMYGIPPASRDTEKVKKHEKIEVMSHHVLRIGLGLLWMLDGALQAQPAMSNQFISGVVQPAAASQPAFLTEWMTFGIRLWLQHPLFYDLLAMWIQLAIGVLLLVGGTGLWTKVGIILSIGWGLVIWIFGEGVGGLFASGSATWLSGTPGSVIFYIVAGLLLLLPMAWWEQGLLRIPMQRFIGFLWLGLAVLQAIPSQLFWTAKGISAPVLAMASMPQPHILASTLNEFAALLEAHPVFWNTFMILIMLYLSVSFLLGKRSHFTWWLLWVWLIATWVLGQDFGVLGGVGTDPNSAPILALLIFTTIYLQNHVGPSATLAKVKSGIVQRYFAH